jgi:hypothetical protein
MNESIFVIVGENDSLDGSYVVLRSNSTGNNANSIASNSSTSSSFSYNSRPPAIRSNSSSSSLPTKDDKKDRRISGVSQFLLFILRNAF